MLWGRMSPWPSIRPPTASKRPQATANAPRPDYSDEAGRWLAERLDLRPGRTVVDSAAGTDRLTRALVVMAARSSPRSGRWLRMRERLAAALTGVELLDGVAEATPLDDPSVHAATVGQAFHHWFDVDRALTGMEHVGRVGGQVGSRL